MKGNLTLVPVYWYDYDPEHVAYRVTQRNGIMSPDWFSPANSPRVLSHDCFHHLVFDDCGYNLDAYQDAHANELIAGGVLYSAGEEFANQQISSAISSFLDSMPPYKEDKSLWESIRPCRKSEWRDTLIDFYLSSDNTYTTDEVEVDTHNLLRALSIAKRGFNIGQRMANIRDVRYIFEKEIAEFISGEDENHPILNIRYDMNRANVVVKPRRRMNEIEVWHSDCSGC